MRHAHRSRRPRGSALSLAILLSVVLSGLLIAMTHSTSLLCQSTAATATMDQAFFAAESGAHRVAWHAKKGSLAALTSPLTGSINGSTYSTSWTTAGSIVRITSLGTCNAASYTLTQAVTVPAAAVPAFVAGGNNGNMSGAVTIVGDIQTQKSINATNLTVTGSLTTGSALNGSPTVGGTLSVNGDCNGAPKVTGNMVVTGNLNASPTVGGNLTVNGVINGNPTVGGTKTTHASATVSVPSPPNVSNLVTKLSATAGATLTNPITITVLNFAASPNGVIYINGDANINGPVTVIGSGTLVVKSNWNQSVKFPPAGTANITLVVAGDINASNTLSLNGGLYGAKNWNQSGGFTITGPTVIEKDLNVSGSGTITAAAAPSFDTRGGATSLQFTNFAGPQP